jgi:hypothetical protein
MPVHAPASDVAPHLLAERHGNPDSFLHVLIFHNLARSCADSDGLYSESGPRIALPAHWLYFPVDLISPGSPGHPLGGICKAIYSP